LARVVREKTRQQKRPPLAYADADGTAIRGANGKDGADGVSVRGADGVNDGDGGDAIGGDGGAIGGDGGDSSS
jgi:hypothetical protein